MKHYAYYLPSGEIAVACTMQEGIDPSGLNGPLHIETPERVSGDTHWVSAGALVAYTAGGAVRKRQPPKHLAAWNPAAEQWEDMRSLQQVKADKWGEIKSAREAAKVAPLMQTPYGAIDADPRSIENIKGTLLGLQAAAPLGQAPAAIDWTMADNSVVALTPAQLGEVAVLLLLRGDAAHAKARPSVPDEQRPAVTDGMLSQRDKLRALGFGDALSEFFGPDGEAALEAKFAAVDDYNPGDGRKANPSETDLRKIRELNRSVAGYLRRRGESVGDNFQGFVAGDVPGDAALREVARAFGARTQWFALRPGLTDLEKRTWGFFNGANLGSVNYLRSEGVDRPHLSILGHEFVHQLKQDDPDLYAEFEDAVRPFINPGLYKSEFLNSPVARNADTPEKKHEEFMAEVGSDAFMRPEFWQALGDKNPSLLRKAADLVRKLIEDLLAKVGYTNRTARYLSDYEQVMKIAAGVLAQYATQQSKKAVDDGIRFAANDDGAGPSFAATAGRARSAVMGLFKGEGNRLRTFNAYDKTLSTQFGKALKDRHYGKVFGLVNAMQNEVSLTSIRPAELAPGILPRVDDVKSAFKTLVRGSAGAASVAKAADAVFAGTLEGGSNVMAGKVWTDKDLSGRFGLDEAGIGLYRQARAAIDASLMELAAAEGYAMSQGFVPKEIRRQLIDRPDMAEELLAGEIRKQIKLLDQAIRQAKKLGAEDQEAELKVAKAGYVATLRKVEQVFVIAKNLQLAGYAPLMRFGGWTVKASSVDPATGARVVDDNGEPITLFYGQYETEREAMAERKRLEAEHEGDESVRVSAGEKSQSAHELYAGISPETLALFAEAVGMDAATHTYYQEALSERSALKRRLQRKGTSGFSQDMPRVLSSFITSNGRLAAQRYYLRDINNAIKYIPNEKGGVKDEAIALKKFVLNPDDAGGKLSTAMFAWFLGGSIASAAVNLTQPVMMTAPYLSQFGIGEATRAMAKAMPYALGKKEISDQALRAALKRAGQEGIVDAQEIFHLYSVGAQGVATGLVEALARLPGVGRSLKAGSEGARARAQAFLTLWGSMFALAEGFNRKLTFISAWEVAQARGEKNPYAFAVRAVNETQGIYNKVNRPNWARGKVGRAVLTFKQYSLMYLELLTRMWKRGGPEGKRAALIMLATLMVLSGEEGLPFAQDLDDLIDTVGQLFGLDTNMRRSKREAARQILGEQWADLALYGISSMLPPDFAGRLGLGNLIPGTALLKPSAENGRTREVGEVFGPAAGLAGQAVDAYDAAVEGNTGKALQNLAPTAVKNALAGLEIAAKGAISDAVGRKVVNAKPGDAAWKGIGFNPTTVAREHRKTMPLQQDIALHKRTESSIVDQWARGLADDDQALVAKAEKRLADWNRSNPESRIAIKPTQIRGRVQKMNSDKDARLLKSAPRELRGRVAEGLDSLN